MPRPVAWRTCALAAGLLLAPSAPAYAANPDCNAPSTGQKDKGALLGRKLTNCGGVLKPSRIGDPEIIIPPPVIDDPMTIHPRNVMPDKGKKS